MDDNLIRFYDEVCATMVQNILVEHERNNKIILLGFNPDKPAHMLYYHISMIGSAILHEPVYIDMPLVAYWKFKLKRWKSRKWIRKFTRRAAKKVENEVVCIDKIMEHVKGFYNLKDGAFDEIEKEFYEKAVDKNEE